MTHEYSESYLMSMNKKDLIAHIRCLYANAAGLNERVNKQDYMLRSMSNLQCDKPHTLIRVCNEDIEYKTYPSYTAAHQKMEKDYKAVEEGGEDPLLADESYMGDDYAVFYGEDQPTVWRIAEGALM